MIKVETLIAAGVGVTQAREFYLPLNSAVQSYDIDTTRRQAGFIAQCMHESANFTRLEENLYYTTPDRIVRFFTSRVPTINAAIPLARNPKALANVAYAGKNGNGDAASGDGWNYRGRGLLQVTGRANYAAASAGSTYDYEKTPELIALPAHAAMTSAKYWANARCNEFMDAGDIDGTTRSINGKAMAGAKERRALYSHILKVLENATA